MASISGSVTIAGDLDDWITVAWDADTHAYAGAATVSGGAYEITGLTAGKAYVVGCRPKSGGVWLPSVARSTGDILIPTSTETPYIYKATSIAADPYFDDVSLLLHMNGTHNSTTFTDVTGKTVTVTGAKISTDQAKFGGASGFFDGSDYLSIPTSAQVTGTEDFTVECWFYTNWYVGSKGIIYSQYDTGGKLFRLNLGNDNKIKFYNGATATEISTTNTWSLGTWNHVSCGRSGNTFYVSLNGSVVSSSQASTSWDPSAGYIGRQADGWSGYDLLSWLDDFRITRGIARYTGTYTNPSAAFPEVAGGSTGETEPSWPTVVGNTVVDGDVTWTNMGQFVRPLMHGPLIAA